MSLLMLLMLLLWRYFIFPVLLFIYSVSLLKYLFRSLVLPFVILVNVNCFVGLSRNVTSLYRHSASLVLVDRKTETKKQTL